MNAKPVSADRLSILHLIVLTTGVGVALFVARGIEYVRFPADAYFYNLDSVSHFDPFGLLVATVYGLAVSTLVLAIRSGDFWSSPGKTLALLFATMCLLNWGLDFIAAIVTSSRVRSGETQGAIGFLFGFWYRDFAVGVGYVACLPVLLWVVNRTKRQGLVWRLAWLGFVGFALAIVAYVHFGLGEVLPPTLHLWYFEVAIGFPIGLLIAAVAFDLARGKRLDWWTAITVFPIFLMWCLGLFIKFAA